MAGSRFGEDVEAEVAARLDPFVMLFGQDGADEADKRVTVGEDTNDISAAPDFLVEPFLGIVRPYLASSLFGKRGECQQVCPGGVEVIGDLGKLVGQCVDDPIILSSNRFSVRLVVN